MPATGFQQTLNRLLRTPNQSAAGLLEEGMRGPSAGVRNGSIAAWARRSDEPSQRAFLALFHELSDSEVGALRDIPRNFRSTLRKTLSQHDSDGTAAVCELLVRCNAFDEFPALVEAAIDPSHPDGEGLAATALQLSVAMHDRIVSYRQVPTGRDPSFARRWALTALVKAVDRYGDHHRIDLVESFLLVTSPDNHTLLRLLNDETHPCHQPLVEALRKSQSSGASELLAAMFDDPRTAAPLLEIAAQRCDADFQTRFLAAIGFPASPRSLASAGRVRKIVWLEKPSKDWSDLPAAQQATALQLGAASRLSRRSKTALADWFLEHGAPLARLAAVDCLATIQSAESMLKLEGLLEDGDASLVARAAQKLHRSGFGGAIPRLAGLLDHADVSVRKTAQFALRDFTFLKFLDEFANLDAAGQDERGRIVARSDPRAPDQLRAELQAATLSRKIRGLQMAPALGLVGEVIEKILELAEHPDVEVRCEAITALASSRDDRVRQAIEAGLSDKNASVVSRATAALAPSNELDAIRDRHDR